MNRFLPHLTVVALFFFLVAPVAVAEELTADDYMEFWKPHEGTWKTTTECNGKTESGTFIFRRARNQKCFLLYLEGTGGASVQQLQGFDPVTRKNVVWGFTGDGDCWFHTIGIDGMKKGTKLATGAGGTWVTRTSSRDGKTTTETEKWKFTQVDEKQFQIFDLYALQGWPARDVARSLGVSVARVYLIKHRVGRLLATEVHRLQRETETTGQPG